MSNIKCWRQYLTDKTVKTLAMLRNFCNSVLSVGHLDMCVVWCGVVNDCMTTLRQWDSPRYQVVTRFPRNTCYLAKSHEFTLSARSGTVTVTLRSKYLIELFQNITRQHTKISVSEVVGTSDFILYWRSCERGPGISYISSGNNSCIPWSFLTKNVVMTMSWWVVNLELCDSL